MTRERPSSSEELVQRDRRHLWHPYTQHGIEADPLPILRAEGAFLYLTDGRRLIDGISSWWSILHGHAHPVLIEAMQEQARELDHVLFAGATHQPAVALAEELLDVAPGKLSRVFYSDNGSTAVEVALKMVLHSWIHAGEPQRRVFIALEGSYHGDTFGAMSVGDPDPFFDPYRPFLFEAKRIRPDDEALDAALDELGDRAAGVIVEPLVQGAAGMRIHPASFLRHLRARCDQRDLPLIAD
jgi:adenosylmethionine-8-amino-7-oxononanoate aminotransferase